MPAFNEAGKIAGTLGALRAALADVPGGYEVVVSDDGSTDATAVEVEKAAGSDPRVRLVRNPHKGRGGALKGGLAAAVGEVVVTLDADLSYGPGDALRLFEHLRKHSGCDLVIGSCYMPGGKVEGVPARRLWASRWGNVLLRFAFHGRFHTTTGILRGYRREKLQALLPTLVSDGKELYLEFLHKALAAGWSIEEIPATLTWRRGPGGGSFSFLPTVWSHLSFLMARRFNVVVLSAMSLAVPLFFTALMMVGWASVAGPRFVSQVEYLHETLDRAAPWLAGYAVLAIILTGTAVFSWVRWRHRLGLSTWRFNV